MTKPSQNLTLTAKDIIDIERIKPLLEQGKTELEIGVSLRRRRETISRKIHKWIQTRDFKIWVKTTWLMKLGRVDETEAFRGLTRLMIEIMRQEAGTVETGGVPLVFRWFTDKEWKEKLSSDTVPIVGKAYFTKAQQDSDASHVEEGGARPVAEPTNSSS